MSDEPVPPIPPVEEQPTLQSYPPAYTPEPPPPPVAPPPKKKTNTWLIVLIVALVVLCCCCVLTAAVGKYFWDNGDQFFGLTLQFVTQAAL
jgi:hypothetical protein